MKIRQNKYPYLLWLTQSMDYDVDLNNMAVKNKETNEEIKLEKTPFYAIFFMKYLPLFFILYWFNIPNNILNLKLFAVAAAITLITFLVFLKIPKYFSKYIMLITAICLYLIWTYNTIALYLDYIMLQMVQITVVVLLIRDILIKKAYRNYYHLEDKSLETKVTFAKQHNRPIFPILPNSKKGLFKIKRGFNLGFNAKLNGYYIRIDDEK
ncbi:hypothetical protein [Halarcobacter ebronensis]|uniref:Uncharacterized protein n=1 Tax=Halarcobacter ebronensis TaxID=1462615 RepID=A0A4V1M0W0_9BACT|nr:hypothetical protein [Halarcobacter ebronensis]QKF80727.1 putative membrane protein [Halarcobacter ebronensis]RXK08520.1 hypothetical protein CRV07_01600 [Halarcobacter ebronensis]